MKICDMCKEKLPTKEQQEVMDSSRICLGGTEQTYDLCFDCSKKVEGFIKDNTKER